MTSSGRTLTDSERLDWLRLIRSENVGPVTFFALLRHFGSAAAALKDAPELSRRGGRSRAIRIALRDAAESELAALSRIGGRLIAWGEPAYPPALAAIADPPPLIQLLGNPALLLRPCIGMVGARNASAAGRRFAREMAAELGRAGHVVVSGMARGIDTASHEGALATGTVAVVAGGVDVVYPPENQALHESLCERGAVLSEQPPGTAPTARHFPPRNRLISGLSLGLVVVEAAPRSGSLITARMAAEQGREVFAVPGSPMDPRYRGTNGLIRDGATLTEGAADVIDGLRAMRPPLGEPPAPEYSTQPIGKSGESGSDGARARIVGLLGPVAVTVDELVRECQLSPPVVLTVLLELELAGRLERHPGNRVTLVP
jgi:DNA processing protein